jgi:hypothetical protein
VLSVIVAGHAVPTTCMSTATLKNELILRIYTPLCATNNCLPHHLWIVKLGPCITEIIVQRHPNLWSYTQSCSAHKGEEYIRMEEADHAQLLPG